VNGRQDDAEPADDGCDGGQQQRSSASCTSPFLVALASQSLHESLLNHSQWLNAQCFL